jgi:methyl-accepting chemotaxis protein
MKGLTNISVTNKLRLLSALFVGAMTVFGMLSYRAFNQVKIGGAAYEELALGNNMLPDFQAPTQFALEQQLRIYQMRVDLTDKVNFANETDIFKHLTRRFEVGHTLWLNKVSDPKMRDLLQKVYEPGHDFQDLALTTYIPMLAEGKGEEADSFRITRLTPLYEAHEKATRQFTEYMQELVAGHEKNAASMIASTTFILVLVGLVAIAIVCGISVLVTRGIVGPLKATVDLLREVSNGNLTGRLNVGGHDEIAQMGTALNDTIDNLSRVMTQISADAQILFQASDTTAGVSQQLGATSQQTTSQASAVSAAAGEVSQNIQTVSTAAEQMSASIKEISKNASEAAEVASSAARLAGSTNATMTKLSESSAEIGNVIKVITSIAEQTNLLALNATIEAARAGEAGKGFAVVANEVKELAKETAKATEDIGVKVEAIQNDAKGAVQAIDEITTVIGRINDIQNTIASAVEEQTGTTNEISRNVTETAKGSSDIASNISGVAASAKATQDCAVSAQKAAGELSKVAVSLTEAVGRFKLSSNGHHDIGARAGN